MKCLSEGIKCSSRGLTPDNLQKFTLTLEILRYLHIFLKKKKKGSTHTSQRND